MKPEESATTGADLLVKALIDEEVEVVFGYPGGAESIDAVPKGQRKIARNVKFQTSELVKYFSIAPKSASGPVSNTRSGVI